VLGARIVGDVLDADQIAWIAAHHERPDGTGYPDGACAEEIAEGAALLGLADAWDSMVSERIYSPRRSVEAALAECRALAGRQFALEAVRALEMVHERGELDSVAARMHRPAGAPLAGRAA
jgi:HD-GYP domain-containing protein (c-di-GMP phosphodiesterase class II)